MKTGLLSRIRVVHLLACLTSVGWAEGIASHNWVTTESCKKLPGHSLGLEVEEAQSKPGVLIVTMEVAPEEDGTVLRVSLFCSTLERGERGLELSCDLAVINNRCQFEISRDRLRDIQIHYAVSATPISSHQFTLDGGNIGAVAGALNAPGKAEAK